MVLPQQRRRRLRSSYTTARRARASSSSQRGRHRWARTPISTLHHALHPAHYNTHTHTHTHTHTNTQTHTHTHAHTQTHTQMSVMACPSCRCSSLCWPLSQLSALSCAFLFFPVSVHLHFRTPVVYSVCNPTSFHCLFSSILFLILFWASLPFVLFWLTFLSFFYCSLLFLCLLFFFLFLFLLFPRFATSSKRHRTPRSVLFCCRSVLFFLPCKRTRITLLSCLIHWML